MPNKYAIKGKGYERELVKKFQLKGYAAKRAWGSDGRSLGHSESVDVLVEINGTPLTIQCKRKRAIPQWIGLDESVNAAVFREDRGEDYILLKLDVLLSLLIINE